MMQNQPVEAKLSRDKEVIQKKWYKMNPKESNQKLPPILAYVYV